MGNKKIDHYSSIISRLPTGRAWRGKVQRAVLNVIADKIQTITDELILISQIKFLLFGDETDETTQLNDELYTLGSEFAMLGDQTSFEGTVSFWEFVLNLIGTGTIEERVDAIISALTNSGAISAIALEKALQDADFDVYVHFNSNIENTGAKVTFTDENTHGGLISSGGLEVRFMAETGIIDPGGVADTELCVNYIDAEKDENLYRSKITNDARRWGYSFFIGGETFPDRANVDELRMSTFRELILKGKPAGMWAFLLIDYI